MAEVNGRRVVLLAEDDTDQAFLARKMLERKGFVVVTALDGEQALTLADVIRPNALVLDLVMPGIDGFEVLKELKERPGPHPTILAVSAMRGYLPKAKELGADDALRKPYSNKLVERLRGLMNGKVSREHRVAEEEVIVSNGEKQEEERRSATTQDILELVGGVGRAPDTLLQDLTERAARVFDVRACIVSLVTKEHDFWAAGCGVQGAPGRVSDRDSSVCSHTIASRAAIVVHDAEENPFFRDSEARGMGIRFYAGVPLTSRTGEALGSLCLLDHRPRDFSWVELELLNTLADVVVGTIEWREHKARPSEPVSSFRHLDLVDFELSILGRDGFNEVLGHLADRAADYADDPDSLVALLVVEADDSSLPEVVRNLRDAFPVSMLGRLGSSRVGVAIVGMEAQTARRLTSRSFNGGIKVLAASASEGSAAAMDTLRCLEAATVSTDERAKEKREPESLESSLAPPRI